MALLASTVVGVAEAFMRLGSAVGYSRRAHGVVSSGIFNGYSSKDVNDLNTWMVAHYVVHWYGIPTCDISSFRWCLGAANYMLDGVLLTFILQSCYILFGRLVSVFVVVVLYI